MPRQITFEAEFLVAQDGPHVNDFMVYIDGILKDKTQKVIGEVSLTPPETDLDFKIVFTIVVDEEHIYEVLNMFTYDTDVLLGTFNEIFEYTGIELIEGDAMARYLMDVLEQQRRLQEIIHHYMIDHKNRIEELFNRTQVLEKENEYLKIWIHESIDYPSMWQVIEELCHKTGNTHIIEESQRKLITIQ
jgi:hypothetical protein